MLLGLRVSFKETSCVFILKCVLSPESGTTSVVEPDLKLTI